MSGNILSKNKDLNSQRRSRFLSWLRTDRSASLRHAAKRRLQFDQLEERRLLTATLDSYIDQGPIKLEDNDWESQVVDQGIAGKLDVGDDTDTRYCSCIIRVACETRLRQ